jgi:hypothetical protein
LTDRTFDHVFCSSLFDFTDKSEVPQRAICGGTGFDITSKLSMEIENGQYDYAIYPKCETSYMWFSRGCDRNCPWCVVPTKEGRCHPVTRKQLNPNGKYLTIMDNDFFANPDWQDVISWIGSAAVDIQGIDVRKMTMAKAEALSGLRRWNRKQFKIAWDNPKGEAQIRNGVIMMTEYMPPSAIMCYVLIGHSSTHEENLHRIKTLKGMKISPYVMAFDRKDQYQKKFQQWVNGHACHNVKWEDFNKYKSVKSVVKN